MNLKEYKKARVDFMKHSKAAIAAEFKIFFEDNANINAIRWTQYTPLFNDGDECVFARHEFDVNGVGDEQLIIGQKMDDDGFYQGYDVDNKTPLGESLSKLEDTFEGTDDVFKNAFGDGVQVTATRKGFKVADYDHD